jgi:hypothetical protein
MLVEGLVTVLINDAGVKAQLGLSRSDNGVFPSIAPDEVMMPYIVYTQVSREVIMSFQGVNRLQKTRIQFSCYGASYKAAKLLAKAVKNVLDGFTGLLTDSDATIVENTIPESEIDSPEQEFKATVFGVHLDYAFWATS